MRTDKRTPVVTWNETIIKQTKHIGPYELRQSRIHIVSDQMILRGQYPWLA